MMFGAAIAGVARKAFAQQSLTTPVPDRAAPPTLFSAPIELSGDWVPMFPRAVKLVIVRTREACLDGVRLLSDHQPPRLRVDRRKSGSPAIWLHRDGIDVAWIIVNIGDRDWTKLAYQFGHELGHVMANSWQADATPGGPSQWLEESIVEALSLRGLGRLAQSWKENPPFAGDNRFGDAIAQYRENIIRRYKLLADQQGLTRDAPAWFADHRGDVEASSAALYKQALSLIILAEYERSAQSIEAIGALNRWPGRAAMSLEEYLGRWELSCIELGASTRLPVLLRERLLKA